MVGLAFWDNGFRVMSANNPIHNPTSKTSVYVPTANEKAAWARAMLPVHDEMASIVGEDLILAIRMEVAGTDTR